MLKIMRPNEASEIAVVTGSKRNKWDNLTSVRCETSRHFRNKMREYLKDKIDGLGTNSKHKNIRDLHRGINDFKAEGTSRKLATANS
jgi:hypothetical protein